MKLLNDATTPATRFRTAAFGIAAAAIAFTCGCATEPILPEPLATTKFTLENTERFAVLDRAAQQGVTCTGLYQRALADGRIEVVANLKNRDGRRTQVQASCLFTDSLGLNPVEESAWQNVTLTGNETTAIRFTAQNLAAKKYTIRVRQGR